MPNRRIPENLNIPENNLENALENVKFYADNTWSFSEYQKANQGLLKQVEELEQIHRKPTKARNVRDCIPNSKLAVYGNYEYDESRELCYASSVSDVSFYYPCIYKRDSIVEPWMLPEVEQIFIWLTYSADFSLLEPLSLEELDRLDDEEAKESKEHCYGSGIFHEIKPLIYENVERAPGRSRYTQCSSTSLSESRESFVERRNKNMNLQELAFENRIKSEQIKMLWYDSSSSYDENSEDVFKSPMGNYFIFDNMKNMRNIPKVFKVDDNGGNQQKESQNCNLAELKILANSFALLEENLLNHTKSKKPFSQVKENSGRRLYSAVVQGVPAKPFVLSRISESTNTLSLANLRSVVSLDETITEQNITTQKHSISANVCQQKCQLDNLPKESRNSHTDANVQLNPIEPSNNSFLVDNTYTAVSPNQLLLNNYNTPCSCIMNFCGNSYLQNYSNPYAPSHSLTHGTLQSFSNNLVSHQPLWLLQQQQLRQQSYYSTTNCHGLMYAPSAIRSRNAQRWPPFFKPLASCVPSTSNTQPYQTWGQNPCTYKRTGGTQYLNSKQNNEVLRSKNRHFHSLKAERNSRLSIEDPNKDDNLLHVGPVTSKIRYFYRSGVSRIISEELERQALEQYQQSDENFCKELEQQAVEQYENSENWISPSNKFVLFGGLIYNYILSALYRYFTIFTVVATY